MSKIALTPNASGDGVFTITAPNSGTNRAIALPDAAGTIPLLAAASNTAITSTPAELNILDGVTSTAAELNILDGVTSTTAELNILDGVTSTAAELNILDGVTATAAEINLIDGGTARGTTALADGDGMLINDAGTMRMSTVQTVKTYMIDGVGGGLVFLATADASEDSSIAFTQLDNSAYDSYVITVSGIAPTTANGYIYMRTSADGGSNYDGGSNTYRYESARRYDSDLVRDTASSLLPICTVLDNNASDPGLNGTIEIYDAGVSSRPTSILGNLAQATGADTPRKFDFNGIRHSNAVTTAIIFYATGTTIKRGTFTLYGRVNA